MSKNFCILEIIKTYYIIIYIPLHIIYKTRPLYGHLGLWQVWYGPFWFVAIWYGPFWFAAFLDQYHSDHYLYCHHHHYNCKCLHFLELSTLSKKYQCKNGSRFLKMILVVVNSTCVVKVTLSAQHISQPKKLLLFCTFFSYNIFIS